MRVTRSHHGFYFSILLIAIGFGTPPASAQDDNTKPVEPPLEAPANSTYVRLAAIFEPGGGGASDRDPDQALANANMNQVNDSQGFRWDINSSNGGISDGSNDAFDGGAYLYINNSSFGSSSRQMTSDGQEYVFSNPSMGNLSVTRRVFINQELATARYLEIVRNTSNTKQNVKVEVRTNLGSTPQANLGSDGKPFAGSLTKDQVGLYAVSRGGSRPSVVHLLTDARNKKYRPSIRINGDDIYITWQLEVPANDMVVLLHGVAQRNGGDPVSVFETLYKRGYMHAQVPKNLRKKVVNFKVSQQFSGTPLVDRVTRLAEDFDMQRGESDLLWVDEETKIAGKIKATQLTLTTSMGKTTVPWEDVAAIVGGGDVEAQMQLLLRNGEVFRGEIAASDMVLSSPDGIDVQIDVSKLKFLLAGASAADNTVSTKAQLMLTTDADEQLLVEDTDEIVLKAATPWGGFDIPIAQIASLVPDEESNFGQRVLLLDGTALSLIPHSSELSLKTSRFGAVSLPATRIKRIGVLVQLKAEDESSESDQSGSNAPPTVPETPAKPYATLIGDNILPGSLAIETLTLQHAAGEEKIDMKSVKRIELVGADPVRPRFKIELHQGKPLEGRLAMTHFKLNGKLRDWTIPATHLLAYEAAEAAPDAEARADADNDSDNRGTAAPPITSDQVVPAARGEQNGPTVVPPPPPLDLPF